MLRFRWIVSICFCVSAFASSLTSSQDIVHNSASRLPRWTTLWQNDDYKLHRHVSTCNAYVLQHGDETLLIDLGDGSVLDQLTANGLKSPQWVLFTGHQRERSQGFLFLQPGQSKIAAPAGERALFEDPLQFRKWYPSLSDRFSVYGASYVRPPQSPIRIDQALEDGERFAWAGLTILCVATPGNSPAGMTFVIETGDECMAFCGGLIHHGAKLPNWFDSEWDYGFGKGIDLLLESTQRLKRTGPQRLLPAYGPAIDDGAEHLDAFLVKLTQFRKRYIRGYPVFDMTNEERDPISQPTAVPGLARVSKHLFKLSDSRKGWNFAIIISRRGHGLILDCGLLPQDMLEQMIVGMREHLGLKTIDAFWISHMHGDHFLLGPWLREHYGAQAWTLDRVADKIENPRHYDYAALIHAYANGFDGMPIDRKFHAGERFRWEEFELQIDWMPGQTKFGCSLWLEIDGKRVVFTGDNLFGNPADPTHDGHEAVVARNSCIFEEGYLHAARYLATLQPDIVMGSHSYLMPDPAQFIRRYESWSETIIDAYHDLLPGNHYEYRFDPYWVSACPYRVDLLGRTTAQTEITIRNFRSQPQHHHVVLQAPPGLVIEPTVLEGTVAAHSHETFPVRVKLAPQVDRSRLGDLAMVTMDITLDDERFGQWFDFLIRIGDSAQD